MTRLLKSILLIVPLLGPRLSAQTLTITNTTIIDVSNGTLQRGTTVVIEGNRIASIGPSSLAGASRGQVVDAKGMYMIPGLWDMHTHAYFDWPSEFGNEFILPLFIANGITGIRDVGSDLDAVLHARDEVAMHRLVGPRMVVSGPMLDGPHPQYKAAIAIATPDDGRKAVDMLKSRGVDFIKIQSGVPREAYFAIADESKKVGIAFEGHVPDAIRAAEAVAAGQRTFEHLIGIFEASSPDEDAYLSRKYGSGKDPSVNKSLAMFLDRYDPAREARIIQLLAQNTVWQCPTLLWERGQWLVDVIDYTKDPDLAYAALELQRFVAAGFTPLEALQTATLNPAKFYGKLGDYGSIRAGRVADLVLLRGNPLDDITNTRTIVGVVADGRYFSQQEIEQLRERLRQLAVRR